MHCCCDYSSCRHRAVRCHFRDQIEAGGRRGGPFPARRSVAKIRVRPKGGVGAAVRAWAAPETMHAQTQAIEWGVQPRERLSAG